MPRKRARNRAADGRLAEVVRYNQCRDCGHLGHYAKSTQCTVQKTKNENAGLNRKITRMTQERESLVELFRECGLDLVATKKGLFNAKRENVRLRMELNDTKEEMAWLRRKLEKASL